MNGDSIEDQCEEDSVRFLKNTLIELERIRLSFDLKNFKHRHERFYIAVS